MSDWDKLWENKPSQFIFLRGGGTIILSKGDQWIEDVKTEGYRIQKQLAETEFQLSCANEALSKTFNKLADEQQKLEAIRGRTLTWMNDYSESPLWVVQQITKDILEVLGDE